MAIYCQEYNKSTAHAINHEHGNESVHLQQMNGRTKGGKKKKTYNKTHTHTQTTQTIYPLYLFFCICYEEQASNLSPW